MSSSQEVSHVSCDLRLTLKLPASGKVEWLERAVRAMGFGKTKIQERLGVGVSGEYWE